MWLDFKHLESGPWLASLGARSPAQVRAFSSSMSCVTGVPVHIWPRTLLIWTQDLWTQFPAWSWTGLGITGLCLVLVAIVKPDSDPDQHPGFSLACHVTMDLHDDLDSLLIPAAIPRPPLLPSLEAAGWGWQGLWPSGHGSQALGSSWPSLASWYLGLEEWFSLPSINSKVPLGSGSTQDVKWGTLCTIGQQ